MNFLLNLFSNKKFYIFLIIILILIILIILLLPENFDEMLNIYTDKNDITSNAPLYNKNVKENIPNSTNNTNNTTKTNNIIYRFKTGREGNYIENNVNIYDANFRRLL